MPNRLIGFSLLFAMSISLCGLGRYLHERDNAHARLDSAVRADGVHDADRTPAQGRDGVPAHHPAHDHERCAVCQLLAAPGLHHLPGTMILVGAVEPVRSLPPVEAAPHCVAIDTSIEARGPPHAAHT